MMRIGKKIETMMAYRGISQPQLAALTEKSQSTVSNWVTGKSFPRVPEIPALARALRTTADWLVMDDDVRTPDEVEEEMSVRKMVDVIGWAGAYRALASSIPAGAGTNTHGGVLRHDRPERSRGAG
jgi:transcriptional regulator with XRE-family HTH domain